MSNFTSVPIELTENTVRVLSYSVLADMANDGNYTVDITSDVLSIDYINNDIELRSPGEVIGKPSVSNASITLKNSTGKYSPNNSSNIESLYSGDFKRNTKIKILCGFVDSTGTSKTRELFNGVITNFKGKYTSGERVMTLQLKDFAKFALRKLNPDHTLVDGIYYESMLFDVTISDAIDYLVDYVYGTSQARDINTLTVKHPVIKFPVGDNVWATMQTLAEACDAKMYFEAGIFKFYTPMSAEYAIASDSQYTFTADNIFDFVESVDEENIKNKWVIKSNPETIQPRAVVVGGIGESVVSFIDVYRHNDGKNAVSGSTITLKSQDDDGSTWIGTFNVPLVDTQTYADLLELIPEPTQDDIDDMNLASTIKVWDKANNVQLTVSDIDLKTGVLTILDEIPEEYDLQITGSYYYDRILYQKYRWYTFDLDKISANIEEPVFVTNDTEEAIVVFDNTETNGTVYYDDWEVFEGNSRVRFKLVNGYIDEDKDVIYITDFKVYATPIECISPLSITAIDGTTIPYFENAYSIENDYIVDPDFGNQLADYYLYRTKSDKSFLEVNTKGIPQIDLLDKITITETTSGINFDFIITGIKHSIKKDGWKTALSLESLLPAWSYNPANIVSDKFYKNSTNILTTPVIPSTAPTVSIGLKQLSLTFPGATVPTDVAYYVIERALAVAEYDTTNKVWAIPDSPSWYAYGIINGQALGTSWIDDNVNYNNVYKYRYYAVGKDALTSVTSSESTSAIPRQNAIDDLEDSFIATLAKVPVRQTVLNGATSVGLPAFLEASGMDVDIICNSYSADLCSGGAWIDWGVSNGYTLDKCSGGTAVGDSYFNKSSSYPYSNAFDNNESTFWATFEHDSDIGGNSYIGYNFLTPRRIRRVKFINYSRVVNAGVPMYINPNILSDTYTMDSAKIEYSTDGSTWTTYSTEDVVRGLNTINITIQTAYQYWRIRANTDIYQYDSRSTYWTVDEVEMFEAAFESDAYFGYAFGSGTPHHVRKISFTQSTTDFVSSVKIQRSIDGTNWVDVIITNATSGVNTISLPASASARYWRILANSSSTGDSWYVYDIKMYEITGGAALTAAFADGFDSNGAVDYVVEINESVEPAWEDLTPSAVNYLYLDRDMDTGEVSYGSSVILPQYGTSYDETVNEVGVDDAYTKVLLHFNGTDAATTFTDESGKTWTARGNAQLDTAQKVFGTASLLLDGNGDWIDAPDSEDFYFGTGDFTIDFRVRFNAFPSSGNGFNIATQRSDDSNFWYIRLYNNEGSYSMQFLAVSGGANVVNVNKTTSPTVTTGTWYHMLLSRSGSSFKWFQDGTQIGTTTTNTNSIPNISGILEIGAYNGTSVLNGWLDEFRISKGIARWTEDFTPPTAAYKLVGNRHWFDILAKKMYTSTDGATWSDCQRVFVGQITAGASSLNDPICYSFMGKYESTAQTPVKSTLTSISHNLGFFPSNAGIKLKCISTEGNYVAGEFCGLWGADSGAGIDSSQPHLIDINTMGYTTGNTNTGLTCVNKTTGAAFDATLAKWAFIFYADRGWN